MPSSHSLLLLSAATTLLTFSSHASASPFQREAGSWQRYAMSSAPAAVTSVRVIQQAEDGQIVDSIPASAPTSMPAAPLENVAASQTTPFKTHSTTTQASSAGTTFPTGYSLDQCIASADSVLPEWAGKDFNYTGVVRNYYVTSEQLAWNYAPSGWDNWLGLPLDISPRASALGYTSADSIGGGDGFTWQKAKYIGYTDNTFTTQTEQPEWAGINGPVMRAEVGDMIQIIYLNKLTQNYGDIHSMGLGYDKANEGSLYLNTWGAGSTSTPQPGAAIPPGGCFTYKWIVGPTNAPAPGFTSHLWSYHPYVNMPADITTGMQGPLIVYAAGQMKTTMSQNREFVLLYQGYDEAQSWLDTANVAAYAPDKLAALRANSSGPPLGLEQYAANSSIWGPQLANAPRLGLSAVQAPTFWSLNGVVFGNTPPFEMCQGDPAIWYIYAFGVQSHTFHLHGNNYKLAGDIPDFFRASHVLNNGEMHTIAMNGSRPGIWQALCHVSSHMAFGMETHYQIYDESSCPLTPLTGAKNATIQ